MNFGFSPFLALRYLKPKRSFVSVITVISVLGVALGVMILVVVIAVFTGFGEQIKKSILGFEPHIVIDDGGILQDWVPMAEAVAEMPGVVSLTPYVKGQVVLDFAGRRLAPIIRAIDPDSGEVERLREKIRQGDFELDLDTVVIGDELADGMGITVGDTLTLYSPRGVDQVLEIIDKLDQAKTDAERDQHIAEIKEVTLPQELRVTGIFDSGNFEFDGNFIFVHLETGQTLYNLGSGVHGLALTTTDAMKAGSIRDEILLSLGGERAVAHLTAGEVLREAGPLGMAALLLVVFLAGPWRRRGWAIAGAVLTGIALLGLAYELWRFVSGVGSHDGVVGAQVRAMTWMDLHRQIFEAVATERQAMYFVLFFLMIVSGFCITNTMITVVFQKRSEIGLLKAVGGTERQISNVFLFQGFIIGVFGVLAGLALAGLVIAYRQPIIAFFGKWFGIEIFSNQVYMIDGGLPAVVQVRDILIISFGSLLACLIAATLPANLAARLEPAKALRGE
ncbi:MAG: ABC transporter permease [Verrucomicrobiae bacterium]|nr:ABC transporter permease [Verrucomicrobiae bacterium]MCP5539193.1 ABC transporter permease [Akkermansiaceae bacterium]MCP5549844.1 ABC transporter permease [Akkermansiaceae bacterium]